jgi:hypothetical protein
LKLESPDIIFDLSVGECQSIPYGIILRYFYFLVDIMNIQKAIISAIENINKTEVAINQLEEQKERLIQEISTFKVLLKQSAFDNRYMSFDPNFQLLSTAKYEKQIAILTEKLESINEELESIKARIVNIELVHNNKNSTFCYVSKSTDNTLNIFSKDPSYRPTPINRVEMKQFCYVQAINPYDLFSNPNYEQWINENLINQLIEFLRQFKNQQLVIDVDSIDSSFKENETTKTKVLTVLLGSYPK